MLSGRAEQVLERERLSRRGGARSEILLPQAKVNPCPHLEARPAVSPGAPESVGFVEAHASLVGERDGADRGDIALALEQASQCGQQAFAKPAAASVGREVDAGLDAPALGRAGSERRTAGEAVDPAIFIRDRPRVEARTLAG